MTLPKLDTTISVGNVLQAGMFLVLIVLGYSALRVEIEVLRGQINNQADMIERQREQTRVLTDLVRDSAIRDVQLREIMRRIDEMEQAPR